MVGFIIYIVIATFILFILPVKAWCKGWKLQSIVYSLVSLVTIVTIYFGFFDTQELDGHLYGYAIIMMPCFALAIQFFIGLLFKIYRLVYAAIAIYKRNSSCT